MKKDKKSSLPGVKKTPFVFYVILVIIPLLFFVFLEIGLRLVDYGYEYVLFKEKEAGVPGMLYVNPEISYKYFGNLSSPVFNSEVGFYKNKPDSSFRVFVLGGSSTQGFPYNPQASFPAHLKRRLALLYPGNLFEVINLGASAINSYTIRDILPEVLAQSPDLVLVYAGHNEYYGALGAGSSRSVNPVMANLLLYLRDFRTVQMLENVIAGLSSPVGQEDKSLMQKMIGESVIDYGSKTYRKGVQQYEKNLTAIIQAIQIAEVPVLIGTLTSNIADQPPFNSSQVSEAGLTADDYYSKGKELIESSQFTQAKEHLIMAKEYDGLRFRTPQEINQIIKNKGATYDIPIVDLEEEFSRQSPGNVIGSNLMCDHLHPNRQGYFLMAKIFSEEIIKHKILPITPKHISATLLDSLALRIFPYTAFDTLVDNHILYSGLGQYPFIAPGEANPYQDILNNDGIDFNTSSINTKDSIRALIAHNHLQIGDTAAFIKEMEVFLSYFPSNEIRYTHAINLLSQLGTLNQGYPLLYESLVTLEQSNAKNKALGMYYKSKKQYDRALTYLMAALEKDSKDITLLLDIGFIQLAMQNYNEAEKTFDKSIMLAPENQEAYHQRSIARFELKNYAGTIEDITESMNLKDSPDTLSFIIRGYAYFGTNNRAKACEDWQASARLGSRQAQMLVKNYCQQ